MSRINDIKSKYYMDYSFKIETIIDGYDFIIIKDTIFLSNIQSETFNSGSISAYSINDKKKIGKYKINGVPKSLERYSDEIILVSKNISNEIILYDFKSDKEYDFIKTNEFLNITKIRFVKNRVFLVDNFSHFIYIYSKEGSFIDKLDLRRKFEFPASFEFFDKELIIINNNNYKTGKSAKYYSGYEVDNHNVIRFDMQSNKIIPLHGISSENTFHPFSVEKDIYGNYFILNGTHIYKYNKNMELIFVYDLRVNLSEKLKSSFLESWFYKLKIKDNRLFVYEKRITGNIYVFNIYDGKKY